MDEQYFNHAQDCVRGIFYIFNTLIALVDIHRELYDVIKFDL